MTNIVMVTFNRLGFTKQSIESLQKHTDRKTYKFTVIDNNSQDGTKEYLTELKTNGIIDNLVLLNENVGVAKAANLGWYLESECDYFLKLDNDIVIQKKNWLNELIKIAKKVKNVGAVAYNFEVKSYPESIENGVKIREKKGGNLGGACKLVPRKTFEKLGYYCEDYGLYGEEDADYGCRILTANLRNIYASDENIGIHLPGGKAAVIDENTLKTETNKEHETERQYREWKDYQRYKNVKNGIYTHNINDYQNHLKPLKLESKYVNEYKKNKVSIIIALFNKAELTKNCLESIYKYTPIKSFELILIDNGSVDNTFEVVSKFIEKYDNIKFFTNEKNYGYALANNQGVVNSNNDFVLLLNNDTLVTQNWLENLVDEITYNEFVAGVGSKLLFENNTIQHAGVVIIQDNYINDPLVARHVYYEEQSNNPIVNIKTDYQALTAACLLLRRGVFNAVGGFDTEYYNGYEDVDLCFKIGKLGYKFTYLPTSVVYHLESQSGVERFAKVSENIKRLHTKWLGKIEYDFIITPEKVVYQNTETSIIIPCYNQLNYTKEAVKSILEHTKSRYKLIMIDNGSQDGTAEFLSELSTLKQVYVITNDTNLGYTKAVNQGLKLSTGNVILANNDIVVTENWLQGLLRHLGGKENVGIAAGMTNYASGVQMLHDIGYDSLDGMNQFAKQHCEKHRNKYFDFPRVIFMCTLISRKVVDKIGYLDEIFSPGNFEDDDYCRRSQLAGFKTRVALDVFTHHFGSASFGKTNDYQELLKRNEQKFIRKWGGMPRDIWHKEILELQLKIKQSEIKVNEIG